MINGLLSFNSAIYFLITFGKSLNLSMPELWPLEKWNITLTSQVVIRIQ